MYHYLGRFELDHKNKGSRFSEYKTLLQINGELFDCSINLVDQREIKPGESASATICFLSIRAVNNIISLGEVYPVMEGGNAVGQFSIDFDPWSTIDKLIATGDIRKAIIQSVGWTVAGIMIGDDITSILKSSDLGLQAWEEISTVLSCNDLVMVKVEEIDKLERQIVVSFVGMDE
jgi:ribosomal protein S1